MKSLGLALAVGLLLVAGGIGCQTVPGETEESREAFAERMKEIEQRIKDAMPKTQEIALNQEVDPETLKTVQTRLGVLREYLDEPTGKMDFITVNAIQAFQRQMRLLDDGLLDERTLRLLEREAGKVEAGETDYFDKGYYAGVQ